MSRALPTAIAHPLAGRTTRGSLLLLSTCCFLLQPGCDAFAPPARRLSLHTTHTPRPPAAAAGGERRPGALSAGVSADGCFPAGNHGEQQGGAASSPRGISRPGFFPRLYAAAAAGDGGGDGAGAATATAPAVAVGADFEDPLAGAPVVGGAEAVAAAPKKRKAAPRKKMSPEEAAEKRKAAALKRKQARDAMTPEELAAKKEAAALKRKEKLANMTPEEIAAKKEAAARRKVLKPKPTPEEVAAKKEALALRKKEKREQEKREWEEEQAKKRYERLAGASVTMEDIAGDGGGEARQGAAAAVVISESAPKGTRVGVEDEEEEEFEGWEFVEDGEEDDEREEVPYWEGEAPHYDDDGNIQGLEKGGLRVANAALTVKDDTIGIKVPTDDEFHWYLLRCFATYELRCRNAVESWLEGAGLGDRMAEIWVPCRQVPKQVGKVVTFKEEPIYQGYVYCNLKMSTQVRDVVNDMDRIVGFVGETRDEDKKLIPSRMDPSDIEGIRESERALGANKIPDLMGVGDLVEISEGPFAMKKGEISKVQDGEYVVKVNTFGRNSDVRLDWGGVRKLSELEIETWFEDTRRAMDATYMERASGRGRGRGGRRRGGGSGFVYGGSGGPESAGRGGRGRGERDGGVSGGRGRRAGLAAGDVEEDGKEAELRRFMEKDLEMWEAESAEPETRVRRPAGERVDAELPDEAFESSGDADDFFDSLGDILGEEKKGPALPGARVQGPSAVERAHAVAEHKRKLDTDGFDFSSPDFDDPRSSKPRPRGTTGSAGLLEPGVSRVSRDAPPASASVADDDDDDLFASLMKELKESPPAAPAMGGGGVAAARGGIPAAEPPSTPAAPSGGGGGGGGGGDDMDFQDLLAELAGSAPPRPPSPPPPPQRRQQQQPPQKAAASRGGDYGYGNTGGGGGGGEDDLLANWGDAAATGAGGGIGAGRSSSTAPPRRGAAAGGGGGGGMDSEFEDLLAGLERGEGLSAASAATSIAEEAGGGFDEIDDLFSELGAMASATRAPGGGDSAANDAPSTRSRQINGRGGEEAMARGRQAGEDIINELLTGMPASNAASPRRPAPPAARQTGPQSGTGPRTGPRTVSPEERQRFREQQERDRIARQQKQQPRQQQRQRPQQQMGRDAFPGTVPRPAPPLPAAAPAVSRAVPAVRAAVAAPAAVPPSAAAAAPAAAADASEKSKPFFSDFDLLPPIEGGGGGGGGRGVSGQGRSESSSEKYAAKRERERLALEGGKSRSANRGEERLPAAGSGDDDFGDLDALLGGGGAAAAAAVGSFPVDGEQEGFDNRGGGSDAVPAPGARGGAGGLGAADAATGASPVGDGGSTEEQDGGRADSSGGGSPTAGGGGGGGEAARAEVGTMKVPELKARCKALGLKVGGKKAELQARILDAL